MTNRVWKSQMIVLSAVFLLAIGCGEETSGGAGGTAGTGGSGGTAGGAGTGGTAGAGGVGGGTACAETDCDDENPCTENLCDLADGTCSNPTFMDGTICSGDENMGRCVDGVCTGLCEFVDCDDGNDCTEDVCDPAHGSCFNPPVSDDTTCDAQGDPGRCSTGLCLGLCADVDCDDGKECTEDLCDKADGSCEHPNRPEGATCDFGGLPGLCESGACMDAELCGLVDCGDGNECTEDVCNPANAACSNPNKVDGAFCETDGNPGLCSAGLCQGLCEGVSCADGNPCTVDMCDPSNASCPNPDEIDGTPCDYGDDPGKCRSGLCVGLCTGVVCNDHNQCTSDACDSATGSCTYTDRADGVLCDFGGVAGVCDAGACRERSWGTAVLIETEPGWAGLPQIAVNASGDAMALWEQTDGVHFNVWANRYTPAGGWGTAELIETQPGRAFRPKVAVDAKGNALAVWYQGLDAFQNRIWSNRYTPTGGWGTAEIIQDVSSRAAYPEVAFDRSGNAVAVWSQVFGSGFSMFSNRYTSSGGWGTAELVENAFADIATLADLAFDLNGNALVVWQQHDYAEESIWANRYTPAGGWGTAETIETGPGWATGPQIATDLSGNALAVWRQGPGSPILGPAPSYAAWANRYTPAGGWGTAELIETEPGDTALAGPNVAVDAAGNGMAVWSRRNVDPGVWANHYTAGGGWSTAQLIEARPGIVWSPPDVASDASGQALVVWDQADAANNFDIWSTRYTPAGGWGTPRLIETEPGNAFNAQPRIAMDPSGRAISVWKQNDGTEDSIWSNRFE